MSGNANHQTRNDQNHWGKLMREMKEVVEILHDPNGLSPAQNNIIATNLDLLDIQEELSDIPLRPPPLVRQDRYPALFTSVDSQGN